jgi:hypothetical protein
MVVPHYSLTMEWLKTKRLILLLAVAGPAAAADRAPLFQDTEVIKAVLTAPITQAYRQREQDVRIYLPGQFTYIDGDGESQRLDVSIRTRGNFRREFCVLPPLQLNFKKSQVKGTLFKKQDKLKVVAPCDRGRLTQQYVLKEYLAYRIYEILTDQSFGTRLMRLSYIDSDEKMSSWTDLVFVIEDDDDVAKRLDLEKVRVGFNEFDQLDQPTTALVDLYQLMIGNNDYSVLNGPEGDYCCHNIEMYGDEEAVDKRIAVPFDFDMSGLVNAKYAAPPSHLPIRSVRTRYYRGICQPQDVLDAAVDRIRSRRGEVMAVIGQIEDLSRDSTKWTTRYIGEYFEFLDDEEAFQTGVIDRCRGREELVKMNAEEPATASN